MKEIWKDIENYEGIYQISNKGRVKSLSRTIKKRNYSKIIDYPIKEKIMTPRDNQTGYYQIGLRKNNTVKQFYIHRLVAQHFINNSSLYINNKNYEVNHIDGNKKNNSIDNLEWVTKSENMKHALKNNLLVPNTTGINSPRRVAQIDIETSKIIKIYPSIAEAMRSTGIGHISDVARGVRKHAKNTKWIYLE